MRYNTTLDSPPHVENTAVQSLLSVIALVTTAIVLVLVLIGLASMLLRAGKFVARTGTSLARALDGPGTAPPPRKTRRTAHDPSVQPPADAANGPAA